MIKKIEKIKKIDKKIDKKIKYNKIKKEKYVNSTYS